MTMRRTIFFIFSLVIVIVSTAQRPVVTILSESAVNIRYDVPSMDGRNEWTTGKMKVVYNPKTGNLTFKNAKGQVVLATSGNSIKDGIQKFVSPKDEYLFGTGQFQDGYLNVRGLTRRLTQVNTQISVPLILSNKGYGLLWNNDGMTDFNPAENVTELHETKEVAGKAELVNATTTEGNKKERREYTVFDAEIKIPANGEYSLLLDVGQKMARKHYLKIDGRVIFDVNNVWLPPTSSVIRALTKGTHRIEVRGARGDKPKLYWRRVDNTTTWRSTETKSVNYTVFIGNADEVIAEYRHLTGDVPALPDWAFGYIHCRERYHSQQEIIETAREFQRRDIPLSVIVQDWQWWGKHGWNAMQFDEEYYPDPKAMTDALHRMGIRLMLSVWARIDRNSTLGKEMQSKGYYIDGTDWVDFFNQDAADFYCKAQLERIASLGVDAWWQDATEPENDDLAGRRVNHNTVDGKDVRNIFSLKVNENVYNSLKTVQEHPFILTRSASQGIQKYGVAVWSGDVGNDWETLRRQIVAGLGLTSTGLPWWTYDAGGFFRPYDQYTNKEYQERMIRWLQTSVFLPLMRVHGYQSETEPWKYSNDTERRFVEAIKLRYRIMPYILSVARMVSKEGYTMMRPLVFDFPDDEKALRQQTEYMFGPALLVNPILEQSPSVWSTYLPRSNGGWRDLWTGTYYDGGQTVTLPVSPDHIPVFVRIGHDELFNY
ncbi:MAG: glycoside hydrolase family 31 protein [Prevotella sp.]|nr:glycoside hydrolase family 31 protein [Prevotella sp.]